MKAAVYYETGTPDVFRYEDVPDPECPPGGVLIDVKAISIEGGDVLNRAQGDMAKTPHIVGYQCSGVVVETAEGVSEPRVGQAVVAVMQHGSHADRVAVSWMQTWVLPEGMDFHDAACVPIPFGTADDCLFEFGGLQEGETVLIQAGAGGVGLAAIQLAKRAGATVFATASSDEKLERLKAYGLDHGINYTTMDFATEARRLTGGRGVNLVVDSVGTTLQGSLQAVGYRGRVVTVGNAGRAEKRTIDIGGMSETNSSLTAVFFGAELMMQTQRGRALVQRHLEDVAAGGLEVVIDRTFALAGAAEAHAYIESRQAFGRVVMVP